MNNSLAERLKKQAANQLYNNRIQNLTQKELILKFYSKSAQYIELAIDFFESGQLMNFRENLNNASFLIKTLQSNLTFIDNKGNQLEVAGNLYTAYNYILRVIGNSIKDNSIKDLDMCITYLNELYFAFDSIQ